jgi:HEAT repeat protein
MKRFVILIAISFLSGCSSPTGTRGDRSGDAKQYPTATQQLAAKLQSDDPSKRIAAARALVKIEPIPSAEVMHWVEVDSSDKTKDRALDAFVELGSEAVPMMLGLIREEKSGTLRRNGGLHGLFRMGSNSIPGLDKAMRDQTPGVRLALVSALRLLGGADGMALPAARLLIQAAKTETNQRTRIYAIDSLAFSHPDASEFVCQALKEFLGDKSPEACLTAACSLARACPDSASDALPILAKGISDTNEELAWDSALALCHLGTNALPILPDIIRVIENSPDNLAVSELIQFLGEKIGDPAFPALEQMATNSLHKKLQMSALRSLGDFSIVTKTNLPQTIALLSGALKHSDKDIRQEAVNSLSKAAVECHDANLSSAIMAMLKPLLKDPDPMVRSDVKRALGERKSNVAASPDRSP